ncbi:ROK family transcriptional regulator [Streptomyces wuyuanensis]|uniref:Winged helix-turn-helix DNA-binding n=1 Tax=Streptomyces wuyuanensis TaxID=1196353 RepID=A0A1H0AXZ4_9ACTN|nr:ROK family transcriptional regulator [Streptomyces wuyuanensis]SDN38259.1 Winged helix-turn-helix DNA-binding [Streptomyces wuyuanensis]
MKWSNAGANLPVLRGHNAALVLDLLRAADEDGISRLELAERTGLTPQAVSKITARLRGDGLATEAGRRASTGGKPRTVLRLVPSAAHAVGLHLDRDELTAVLVDLAGTVVASRSRALELDGAVPGVIAAATDEVRALLADGPERVLGVGVGMPGPLDHWSGVPGRVTGAPGWAGVPLRDELAERLGLPVVLDKDTNAAALALALRGRPDGQARGTGAEAAGGSESGVAGGPKAGVAGGPGAGPPGDPGGPEAAAGAQGPEAAEVAPGSGGSGGPGAALAAPSGLGDSGRGGAAAAEALAARHTAGAVDGAAPAFSSVPASDAPGSFAYLHLGTGLGAGLVIGGAVHRGARTGAGEFGHQVVQLDGPVCPCGNRGCIEALCLAAVSRGEIDEAARVLGTGAANLVRLLDVDQVLLGGRTVLADAETFVRGVRAVIGDDAVHVALAETGAYPVAEGAAQLVLAPLFGRMEATGSANRA